MAEISHWEKMFVERYIVPEKRDRYLAKLKGPKHRPEILERLNHNLDLKMDLAVSIPKKSRNPAGILKMLQVERVDDTCYIMVDGNQADGQNMRLERAVEVLCSHFFGIILICPPVPIAIYKEEDIGEMLLLKPAE